MSGHIPFCSVPPEIFLSICRYLSEPDFLSLKLASPQMNQLVTSHAATLCNTLICARYPREAALLGSKLQDGWLVPTHPCVLSEEARARNRQRHIRSKSSASASSFSSLSSSSSRSRDTSPSSVGSSESPIRYDLSVPGPQYLRFLAEYNFEIRVAEQMFLACRETDARLLSAPSCTTPLAADEDRLELRDQPAARMERFGLWVGLYCVRRFLERLRRVALDEAGRAPGKGECRLNEHEEALVARTRKGIEWFYA